MKEEYKDKIINCKEIAQKIKDEVKERSDGKNYSFTIITNPNDEAGKVYVKNKKKCCEYCGIQYTEIALDENVNMGILHNALVEEMNPLIVQLPINDILPEKAKGSILELASDPERDADGLCEGNKVIPATAKGVIRILKEIDFNLEGKHVVVVNRSKLIGKPLIDLLLKENATVTVCHSYTQDLSSITSKADILITGTGKAKMFTSEYVKDGAIVIDCGINRDENGKLCGDVDIDDVIDKVSKITPVPGGCGVLTTACLMENIVELYEMRG